ncbi:MAG TPA: ribosomal protein S18-alanine N-acetyltransferase [Fredinandcohnia sp.]|nr:ribosomal protein S18-alanine N-acetyltransferase [Fredinandcohnia sp.]
MVLVHPEERIPRGGYWIHVVKPEHLPQVLDLEARSFDHPWSPELVTREMRQDHSLLLAISEGETVVGFVIAWMILDELHILNVAVCPERRRRGIARLLLGELLERAGRQGFVLATLEVRVSNHAAIELYRGLGFRTVGRRRNYYADGEDALIMDRSLP